MRVKLVTWSLLLVYVHYSGAERCGQDGLGFRCEDSGECWDKEFVCDGFENCEDGSDEGEMEGQGCNLYPESGCASHKGDRHWKCQRTGECFNTQAEAAECETSPDKPRDESGCSDGQWKCFDGRCIKLNQVCDAKNHCRDKSDESTNITMGCNRYGDPYGCRSLFGSNYSRCAALEEEDTLICTDLTVDPGDKEGCRKCPPKDVAGGAADMWRCNDGECIELRLLKDGKPDCRDRSDEETLEVEWLWILLATIIIVLVGILISYACRALNVRNCRGCFHCNICSSNKKCKTFPECRHAHQYTDKLKVPAYSSIQPSAPPMDGSGGAASPPADETDHPDDWDGHLDELYPDDDIPYDLIELLDDKDSNWDKRFRDSWEANLYNERYSPTALKPTVILDAKKLYVEVHLDPIRYHHLYMYLANRSATVKQLSKVTRQLLAWELEMHGQNKLEVIKCWRLHLGSSELTGKVINSVADDKTLLSRCESSIYPARLLFRRFRRWTFGVKTRQDTLCYKATMTILTTLIPFIEAAFFYFEQIKNLVYVHIFWSALTDMSKGRPFDHQFEFFLIFFMIAGIVLTQVLFLGYSFVYAEEIFEVGHTRKECRERDTPSTTAIIVFFKIISVLLSPLIPCYVLANHIYYESKLGRLRRHLQTAEDLGDGFDAVISDEERRLWLENRRRRTHITRMGLYKLICSVETKSLNYRKLYSYFRVTSAVLESVTQVIVIVLLLFVTGRRNRPINLVKGVEYRLYSFFGISDGGNYLSELNLMRDVVMLGSLVYSLSIVLTALVKYWYQSKNRGVSFEGQVILGIYFFFLSINRLTTIISLFATTQKLDTTFDNGDTDPKVTLAAAFIIFIALVGVLRPAVFTLYKWYFSRNFKLDWPFSASDVVDRLINVLVNCLVVIPFMVQTESIMVLKEAQRKFNFSPEKQSKRRDSLKRKAGLMRIVSTVDEHGRQVEVVDNFNGIFLPNMNFFTAPLLYDDLRKHIRDIWWEDPSRKVTTKTVKDSLQRNPSLRAKLKTLDQQSVDENIRITLEHLEFVGMINKPLLNPVQSKREYFWLFLFVILENSIALGIEVGNGGVMTSQGHYYSWDIRLLSLLLALIFLLAYYKKYHLTRDITSNPVCGGWLHHLPVCCCCLSDTRLAAPPNEEVMERMMSKQDLRDGSSKSWSRTIQTQTSYTDILESALPNPPTCPPDYYMEMKNNPIISSGDSSGSGPGAGEKHSSISPQKVGMLSQMEEALTSPHNSGGRLPPPNSHPPPTSHGDASLSLGRTDCPLTSPVHNRDIVMEDMVTERTSVTSVTSMSAVSLDVTGRTLGERESPRVRASYKQANQHVF